MQFDASVFTGEYVTGDVSKEYLDCVAHNRNDSAKQKQDKDDTHLEMYNEK